MNPLATRTMGIKGPALVTVTSLLVIFLLMVQIMDKKIWKIVGKNHFVVKLIGLLVGMYFLVTVSIFSLEGIFAIRTTNRLAILLLTLVGILIGASFYGFGLVKGDLLNEEEFNQLPFRSKIKK